MILQGGGRCSSARPQGRCRASVRHLPGDSDAAPGIVLGGRALRRRRAVAEARLQLQILAEIDVHLYLAIASRRLRRGDVDPLRDVLSGRDARTARLRAAARAGSAG